MSLKEDEWVDLLGSKVRKSIISAGVGSQARYGNIVTCTYTLFLLQGNDDVSSSSSSTITSSDIILDDIEGDAKSSPATTTSSSASHELQETVKLTLIEESSHEERFQIGESDTCPGLELGLKSACENEFFKLRISSSFGYGSVGRIALVNSGAHNNETIVAKEIPPNSTLEYHIRVKSIVDLDASSSDFSRPLESVLMRITLRKDCGNRWYKFKEYNKAVLCYSKVSDICGGYIDSIASKLRNAATASAAANVTNVDVGGVDVGGDDIQSEEIEKKIFLCYISSLNNMASAKIHTREYSKANEFCIMALTANSYVESSSNSISSNYSNNESSDNNKNPISHDGSALAKLSSSSTDTSTAQDDLNHVFDNVQAIDATSYLKTLVKCSYTTLYMDDFSTCAICISKIKNFLDSCSSSCTSSACSTSSTISGRKVIKINEEDIVNIRKETLIIQSKLELAKRKYNLKTKEIAKKISKKMFSLDGGAEKGNEEANALDISSNGNSSINSNSSNNNSSKSTSISSNSNNSEIDKDDVGSSSPPLSSSSSSLSPLPSETTTTTAKAATKSNKFYYVIAIPCFIALLCALIQSIYNRR